MPQGPSCWRNTSSQDIKDIVESFSGPDILTADGFVVFEGVRQEHILEEVFIDVGYVERRIRAQRRRRNAERRKRRQKNDESDEHLERQTVTTTMTNDSDEVIR